MGNRLFSEIVKKEAGIGGIQKVTIKMFGRIRTYKVYNDIWYVEKTPDSIIFVLNSLYEKGSRFRIHYGDVNTGEDWLEENGIMGNLGKATGEIPIPLLISTCRSTDEVAILSDYILKITEIGSGKVLWEHPKYQIPVFEVKQRGEEGFPSYLPDEYTTAVYYRGKNQANFKDSSYAEAYVAFMRGEQNVLRPLTRTM